jgi:hypothetical protein
MGEGGTPEMLSFQIPFKVFSDELAVEAAVFDEDFVGAFAGDDDAAEVDARNIGLERGGIADRASIVGCVECDAERFDESEVGVVTGQREDEVIWQRDRACGCCKGDVVFADICNGG